MLSTLIRKLAGTGRAWPGGLQLDDAKHRSAHSPIRALAPAPRLVVPLKQHIGEAAEVVVAVGQRVARGQRIAGPKSYFSIPAHAPAAGTVLAVDTLPVPHPSGLSGPCVVIEPDGSDASDLLPPLDDWPDRDPAVLRNRIRDAGIVGMGGAGFPTFVKLNPGPEYPVHTLVINGVECEPYITCDDRLMREHADQAVAGARILARAVGATSIVVAVEHNKPEAISALEPFADDDLRVAKIPTRYPAGDERMLVASVTGRRIAREVLPAHIGVLVQNVATAAAAWRAVALGEPSISRTITVTGPAMTSGCNLEVPLGTPMRHLLGACGVEGNGVDHVVMGGPMMGFRVPDLAAPVIKTSNCLLAMPAAPRTQRACIRCGECANACPIRLSPQALYWHARAREFDAAQDLALFDCIECGCCAYVCPSAIPLVDYYRFSKTEIWAAERERGKSDLARQRHQQRDSRIAREQAERQAKRANKRAPVARDKSRTERQAAIEAALARAKAKRAAAEESNGPAQ